MDHHNHKRIYLAGPLFTQAERLWNKLLAEAMQRRNRNVSVILPQQESVKAISDDGIDFRKIMEICIDGIDDSDIIIAVLDGADSDSGTCFECGYAYAKNKTIIGIRTDMRSGEDNGLNAMLSQTCHHIIRFSPFQDAITDIDALAERILALIS